MGELKVGTATTILRLVEERLRSEAPAEHDEYIKLSDEEKFEYIRKNRELLDVGYDKELMKSIDAVLHALLEKVVTEEISKEIVENHIPRSNRSMHNIFEFRIILQKYANYVKRRSSEEESRLSLPYYLMIVESVYTADINLLVYLLVKSGLRYYRSKRDGLKVYVGVDDLQQLYKETLFSKLTFLRENGFSVVSDICDRHLRNSIAHMSFIVFSDGSVAYEKNRSATRITEGDLEAKIAGLLSVCQCIMESLRQFYGRKYGDLLMK